MASSGRLPKSEPRKKGSSFRSNFSDGLDERPSYIEGASQQSTVVGRPNNWDFSDWRPSLGYNSGKRIKKENPDKERDKKEKSLITQDSPPSHIRHHTPSTFPRTRITVDTPVAERMALENLKQQLNFSDGDELSVDSGERNNERNVPSRRVRSLNYEHQDTSADPVENHDNRNNNQRPDSNHIVGRLMQIRDYIKQATAMMESLERSGDTAYQSKVEKLHQVIEQLRTQESSYMDLLLRFSPANRDQRKKLSRMLKHMNDQEQGYMSLLQNMLSSHEEASGATAEEEDEDDDDDDDDDEDNEDDDTTSVDIDVQSQASEATTDMPFNANSRPRIEDKLGLFIGLEEATGGGRSRRAAKEDSNAYEQNGATNGETYDIDELERTNAKLQLMQDQQEMIKDLLTGGAKNAMEKKNEELDQLKEQRDLLKKMLEQQKMMRDLQTRQVSLLQQQKDAEETLVKGKHMEEAAATGGSMPDFKPPAMLIEKMKAEMPIPPELADLRQRLDYLKNMFQPRVEMEENKKKMAIAAAAEHGDSLLNNLSESNDIDNNDSMSQISEMSENTKHERLRQKLEDLQEKKKKMDELLSDLGELRQKRFQEISGSEERDSSQDDSITSSLVHMNASQMASDMAEKTVTDANEVLEILDAKAKLKKLHDVHERLDQLKGMMQYYQSNTEFIHGDGDGGAAALPSIEATNDEDLLRRLRSIRDAIEEQEVSNDTGAAAAAAVNEDEDDDNNESDSQMGSLGPWKDDPDIKLKVEKLHSAQERLKRLQDMMAKVQQLPNANENELLDMMSSLELVNKGNSEDRTLETSYTMSEGEIVPGSADEFYQATMQQQKEELNTLLKERERLMSLQGQLENIYDNFSKLEDEEGDSILELAPAQPVAAPATGKTTQVRMGHRDSVTFQETPEVISNEELYDRMRCQRILREELRDQKKELDAILKKDISKKRNQDNQTDDISDNFRMSQYSGEVTTMATWGGSTTENIEENDETNAAKKKKKDDDDDDDDTSSSSSSDTEKDDDDDDDAYPSDGVVQVEEEEEEAGQEGQSDHDTYTIDDNQAKRRAINMPMISASNSKKKVASSHKFKSPKQSPNSQAAANGHTGYNAWAPGNGIYVKGWPKFSKKGRKGRLRQENYRSPEEIINEEGNPVIAALKQQLNETNAVCEKLMADQQNLNQLLGQANITSQPGFNMTAGSPYRPYPDVMAQYTNQLTQQQLMFTLAQCQRQLYTQQLEMGQLQQQIQTLSSPNSQHVEQDFRFQPFLAATSPACSPMFPASMFGTLTPHGNLPPTARANFSSVGQQTEGGSGGRKKPSPKRRDQTTTTDDKRSPSAGRHTQTERDYFNTVRSKGRPSLDGEFRSVPVVTRTIEDIMNEDDIPKLNLEEILNSGKKLLRKSSADMDGEEAVTGKEYKSTRKIAGACLSSKKKTPPKRSDTNTTDYARPGLSSNISGTAFLETMSQSSALSSIPPREGGVGEESDNPNNVSLFDALRKTIYSEVATLISQNEQRPHFLIELFRELQLLNNDYLRQRVLYSVQDLISKFLTESDSVDGSAQAPPPRWLNQTKDSEQTPSESLLTSEDEDVVRTADRPNLKDLRSGSLRNEFYDYTEKVESISTMSTPTSTSAWDNPFAQETLGNTVIHLDKAMQRMREFERQLERETSKDPDGASPKMSKPDKLNTSDGQPAHDGNSESSISEISYPRIDTQQLDSEIKAIMTEVIPVLKQHQDDLCEASLLSYIRQLVLYSIKEDDQMEFSRFFRKQLNKALMDILHRFEGRRLRECSEDILVDMSEILFNELAFFRLMQTMDDPTIKSIPGIPSWKPESETTTEASAAEGQDDPKPAADGSDDKDRDDVDEEGTSDAVDEDDDIGAVISVTQSDEEDLGKARDDDMARTIDITEKDGESERTSPVKIELAVSETIPYTRIGSDEDDEDDDDDESAASAGDPAETAVSRAAQEERQAADEKEEKDTDYEKDIDEQEERENAGLNGDEITVDDLPPMLFNNNKQSEIQKQMEAQEQETDSTVAVISIIDDMIPAGEAELIGDGNAAPEPPATETEC
ncbi:pericentriolar material 1 protein-like isoform X3 [Tubulanus polymorphus]|uniref:pericentriolar material 1 protein-like isoform X3 n=1 Tax=Tubulanus polymorphus TaxID=672921 RepID=UPI003DA68CBA